MNIELPQQAKIEAESGYEACIPEEFKADPFGYFQANGENLTPWKDNLKVKAFSWQKENGEELPVVAKIASSGKNDGDPFYEYKMMEIVQQKGLPGPKPVAKAEYDGHFMIITERLSGITFADFERFAAELISEKDYSKDDVDRLAQEAKDKMEALRQRFIEAGIFKDHHKDHWKMKDMVFDVDVENKMIRSVIPTDFERTILAPLSEKENIS